MNLHQRFAAKTTSELIIILESQDGYTPEALTTAEEELRARNIPEAELKKEAWEYVLQVAQETMNRLDPLNDELVPPESHFLTKREVKEIYLEELEALIKRKEGFRFDVWKYAIGGF